MKPKRGNIIINDREFSFESANTEILKYIKEHNVIRIKNAEDAALVRSMLIEKDMIAKKFVQVTVMCRRCKQRYNAYTGGDWYHCDCGATSYSSDGLDVKAHGPYRLLLIDPSIYDKTIGSNTDFE